MEKSSIIWEDLVTNESIDAIIRGLEVYPQDVVLSICGSGDQSFAFIERANRILVVDNRVAQIEYLLQRKRYLESGDFKEFLSPQQKPKEEQEVLCLEARNKYFLQERLKNIQAKLRNSGVLNSEVNDIFSLDLSRGGFNKVYLSNTLSYDYGNQNVELTQRRLQRFVTWLPLGGLIYISDGKHVLVRADLEGYDLLRSLDLKVNDKLTKRAQKLQAEVKTGYEDWWLPLVFQKIG